MTGEPIDIERPATEVEIAEAIKWSVNPQVATTIRRLAFQRDRLAGQRDAWRAACKYLYNVISEGGKRWRPMDLISQGEWRRLNALIDAAESLEDKP